MQESLENPHFKKIWGKVIMNRHLGVESLEEALFLETYNTDCNVLHCGLNLIVSMQSLCLLRNSGFHIGDRQYHAFSQSFGRPITLEEIISILNRQPWENRGWIESFRITETVNRGEYHINIYDKDYAGVGLCFWQLRKPLHEQTPETWEEIANLI